MNATSNYCLPASKRVKMGSFHGFFMAPHKSSSINSNDRINFSSSLQCNRPTPNVWLKTQFIVSLGIAHVAAVSWYWGWTRLDVHDGVSIPCPAPQLRFLEQLAAAWASLSTPPPLVTWASLQCGGPWSPPVASPGMSVPKNPNGDCEASYDLASCVIRCYSCHMLLVKKQSQ